jgi:uncharacterized membrane protein (DUF2068 family)
MSHDTRQSGRLVLAIGVFKLAKALSLLVVGVAGILGIAESWLETVAVRIAWTGAFPGRETLRRGIGELLSVNERTVRHIGMAAIAYAVVFGVEGVSLLLRKRWAEWLVVGVTASFVPLEVYELLHRFGAGKVIALVLNLAIAAYLAWDRMRAPALARPVSPAA